jgi:hypothetical protein
MCQFKVNFILILSVRDFCRKIGEEKKNTRHVPTCFEKRWKRDRLQRVSAIKCVPQI